MNHVYRRWVSVSMISDLCGWVLDQEKSRQFSCTHVSFFGNGSNHVGWKGPIISNAKKSVDGSGRTLRNSFCWKSEH